MTYDQILGWKLLPRVKKQYSQEEKPYLIETNSKGLRDKEYSYEKPENRYRVVILGDSFVFGSGGVNSSHCFTEIMEAHLKNVDVINMGIPAFSLDQECLYLESEAVKYHPDIIILCLFVNDYEETFVSFNNSIGRPKGYFSKRGDSLEFHPPVLSWSYILTEKSYLLGWVEHKLRVVSRSQAEQNPKIEIGHEDRLSILNLLLANAIKTSKKRGAEFLVVYIPFKGQSESTMLQESLGQLHSITGLKVIDLMEPMIHAGFQRSLYFKTDIHLNNNGHQFVADYLMEYLVKNTVLNEDHK